MMKATETKSKLTVAAMTDRGLSEKRPVNEDSFLADATHGIFAVADGVGGAQSGEVASRTAIVTLGEAFDNQQPGDDVEDLLELAVQRANSLINSMSRGDGNLRMMATTIVALHIGSDTVTFGHVGDSRIYRLSPDGNLSRETVDHSMVEEEVRAGRLTEAEAAAHPHRNIISRALGAEPAVEVDLQAHPAEEGAIYLLCSDGITRHIPDDELQTLLQSSDNLDAICEEMKRLCYERGAEDNLTAVLVQIGTRKVSKDFIDDVPTIGNAANYQPPAAFNQIHARDNGDFAASQDEEIHVPDFASLIPQPAVNLDNANARRSKITINSIAPNPTSRMSSDSSSTSSHARRGNKFSKTLMILLLLAIIIGAAFYGGIAYQQSFTSQDTASPPITAEPQPTAPPQDASPLVLYEEQRAAVDSNPGAVWFRMTQEKEIDSRKSQDPEFMYLYGRASLLKGEPQAAMESFRQSVEIIKTQRVSLASTAPLSDSAAVALQSAEVALRSDAPQQVEIASKWLDDFMRQTRVASPANINQNSAQPAQPTEPNR